MLYFPLVPDLEICCFSYVLGWQHDWQTGTLFHDNWSKCSSIVYILLTFPLVLAISIYLITWYFLNLHDGLDSLGFICFWDFCCCKCVWSGTNLFHPARTTQINHNSPLQVMALITAEESCEQANRRVMHVQWPEETTFSRALILITDNLLNFSSSNISRSKFYFCLILVKNEWLSHLLQLFSDD